jgi:hypothetical protein
VAESVNNSDNLSASFPAEGGGTVNSDDAAVNKTSRREYLRNYMRDYRAKHSNKSGSGELINPEINNIPPPPEINAAAPPLLEQKSEISEPDEAAQALQKQIAELRKSEELNRQRQEQVNHQQQEHQKYVQYIQQAFQYWKANGLTSEQEQIFAANPAAIGQLTNLASQQAAEQGHQLGTAEHTEAGKKLFFEHLAHLQEQAQPQQPETAMTETPRFFQPPPQPRPRPNGPIVSAPVSRETPGMRRAEAETDPRRVTLSVEEREIARASGISEIEYARNKIRMMKMKAEGQLQG